jgi:serine protease Do
MNRNSQVGISLSDAVSKVAAGMREITVKVSGSKGRHGSGTVWRSGLIVTNAHVANSQVHDVEFATGMKAPGWLVARDRDLDLAALAVSAPFAHIAAIRSAFHLRAGEMVLALGNPFDGRGSVSTGIVHCPVGKSFRLLADIRLAPGYSGGPLAETSGTVIGINSMIVGPLGCAITSDAVEEFLSRFHLSEAA